MSEERWQTPVRFTKPSKGPKPSAHTEAQESTSPVRLPAESEDKLRNSASVQEDLGVIRTLRRRDRVRSFALKLLAWSVVLLILSLSGLQIYRFVAAELAVNATLGWFYFGVLSAIILALIVLAAREATDFARLRTLAKLREESHTLLTEAGFGKAIAHCKDLYAALKNNESVEAGHERFKSRVKDFHTDTEVLALFSQDVLAPLDAACHRLIEQQSLKAALFAAVSPFAALDAALMLWRGARLIRLVAQTYGGRPGAGATFKLGNIVIQNLVFAGAAELLTDAASDALGNSLLSALSSRAGQGLANGLLTARIGLQAMALCRPVPLTQSQGSSLRRISIALFQAMRGKNAEPKD
jgi:putative membrane protein